MDRYTKGFVVASLMYFFLAAVLGIWMGGGETGEWVRFAHVHFNLLGWMSMMIYGVGYFILPRFNGRTLRWPSWLPAHFYIANIGLVGMVATAPGRPSAGFVLFSALSVLSAGMFVANLAATILMEPKPGEEESEAEQAAASSPAPAAAPGPAAAPALVDADTRVGDILARWPETVDIFAGNGFPGLKDAGHREHVMRMGITVRMACNNHGVDPERMVLLLNDAIAPRKSPIGPDHILGDILKTYPKTEKVFRKYYGNGCFSCPGQATESVRQSALLHNVSEKQLLAELNAAAGS